MKAAADQQRTLAELVEVDADLTRIAYRRSRLEEDPHFKELQARSRAAEDRLAALRLALDDLGAEVDKYEREIDAVAQREDRDRALLEAGAPSAKQITDLQHELQTLQRRQENLEDSLLEVLEQQERLNGQQSTELAAIDELRNELGVAQRARDESLRDIDRSHQDGAARRAELLASLDPALAELYERQRSSAGVGAGLLQGRRCGACRIELDRGEIARISAAADDDLLRCPECRAILLRDKGSGK